MSITARAIQNNRVTLLALAVVCLSGLTALFSLPRAEDPGFTIRTALVTTYLPGASPSRVENLVTDAVEEAVQEIPELDFVSSTTRTGVSLVFVNILESYSEMRPIWDDLRRKMQALAGELPSDAIGPIVDDDFGDVFPIMLTVSSQDFTFAELKDIADDIRDDLLYLDQVAQVDIYGAQDENIFVEYNTARLAEVGLSPGQLQEILRAQNIIISGGTLVAHGEDISLEPSGNFESFADIRQTLIPLPNSSDVIYLEDLARIRRSTIDPPRALMHANGRRCLGLSIAPPEGIGNVSELGVQVEALVEGLRDEYPLGIDLDLVIFQPAFIDAQVEGFIVNLAQAIGIVLLVMLISLGLRTGIVVSTVIPMAMLATLFLMQSLSIGLNQISIAALIIALGMLVDNAIVMSESIMVQMGSGKSAIDAAVDSAAELRIPLLTSSLTTAAAFLPIYLAESSVGEYTGSLFTVVSLALLSSWALALTVMPLLCVLFLRVKQTQGEETFQSAFYSGYRNLLLTVLRFRLVALLLIFGVFALAIYGLGFVPNEFMPKSDSARLIGELDYPLGTSIHVTEETVYEVERHLRENHMADGEGPGFLSWSTYVGSQGGPRYRLAYDPAQDGSEHASMILTATSREFIDGAIPELEQFVEEHFPELQQSWKPEGMGPSGDTPIEVRLRGPDVATLFERVDEVKAMLREIPGTFNIEDNWGSRTKKLRVEIDQARAQRVGVTSSDVAISLTSSLSGIELTEYREDEDVIPVILRSVAADRTDIGKVETINVFSQATGNSVPLRQIADIRVEWEPSKILRRDRYKSVTVGSQLDTRFSPIATAEEVVARMDPLSTGWPRGYEWEMGGDFEGSADANESIAAKLPIAGFIILLLLVSQFNSMRKTSIILLTIPLGLIGVSVGLLISGQVFSFFALLGVISLAGIIINNAIVLIDRINIELQENGRAPNDAIIESAQRRLRPILVTTMTTVGGLLPLWIFGGPMWAPMAVSIIFGLLFATALTLGVVPLLYSIFFRVNFKGYRYGQPSD